MTWVTDSGVITAAMTTNGYTRITDTLKTDEAPGSFNNKYYTLSLGEPQVEPYTNDRELVTNNVIIEIRYKHTTNAIYDSNYDSFMTIRDAIKDLAGFVSWNRIDFPRNENTNKEVIATLEFYYGVRTC